MINENDLLKEAQYRIDAINKAEPAEVARPTRHHLVVAPGEVERTIRQVEPPNPQLH